MRGAVRRAGVARAAAVLLAALAVACGGKAPSDHTISEGGAMHRPGLTNPTVNCAACHGASLQGGQGPSCTACHGVKW